MSEPACPHCGQPHAREVAFCPTTGRPVPGANPPAWLPLPDGSRPPEAPASPPPAAPEPAPAATQATAEPPAAAATGAAAASASASAPEKGVADLLKEAVEMYRLHARALLVTCAFLFVPISFVKSSALSVILGPVVAAPADGVHPGELATSMLWFLARLVTGLLLYGIMVPLTSGALTLATADRILGGQAGWREAWMLLFRRLAALLSAIMPVAALIAVALALTQVWVLGPVFLVGLLALGLFFAFVSPVVLVEGVAGRAALRRSAALAWSDWLRVAIMIIVLAVICWVAEMLAHLLIPHWAPFFVSLFGDLFTMVALPVPAIALVLLYFDIRRKHEHYSPDRLRADVEALRGA